MSWTPAPGATTTNVASRLIALAQKLLPGFEEAASSLDRDQALLGQAMGEALRPPLAAQTFFETFTAEPAAKPLCARLTGLLAARRAHRGRRGPRQSREIVPFMRSSA